MIQIFSSYRAWSPRSTGNTLSPWHHTPSYINGAGTVSAADSVNTQMI